MRETNEPTSAEEMLDVLDTFLSNDEVGTMERLHVWNCLTALRGPDHLQHDWELEDSVKQETTAVIRSLVLPKCARQAREQRGAASPASLPEADGCGYIPFCGAAISVGVEGRVVRSHTRPDNHFDVHVSGAVNSLLDLKRYGGRLSQ